MNTTLRFAFRAITRAALVAVAVAAVASAAVITTDISTAAGNVNGNWFITALGPNAINAQAYAVNNGISITSNSLSSGTWVGTAAQQSAFDGFWIATLNFTLPVGATVPTLTFTGFNADDRALLELNGTIIGSYGLPVSSPSTLMQTADPGSAATYGFGVTAGTITAGFVTGINHLTLIVNNTDNGGFGTTKTFQNGADYTGAILLSGSTFSYTVPEPGTVSLLVIGLGPLAYWLRKKRSR